MTFKTDFKNHIKFYFNIREKNGETYKYCLENFENFSN